MGSELLGDSFPDYGRGKDNSAPLSFSQLFEDSLPMYMAMGMSIDEFMNGDPFLAVYYRKAYTIKKKEKNELMWLQGAYIYEAILRVAPRLNSLKPKQPEKYIDKPYDIYSETAQKDAETADLERKKAMMELWAERVNRKWQTKHQK